MKVIRHTDLILREIYKQKEKFRINKIYNNLNEEYGIKSKLKIKELVNQLVDEGILKSNGVSYWF